MGLFGFGKNKDVVDLAERYRKQKEREQNMKEDIKESNSTSSASPFSFFDAGSSASSSESSSDDDFVDLGSSSTDKRRKLAKRILDMTTRIEDLGNQIYHLQQRLELIEKKLNVNF